MLSPVKGKGHGRGIEPADTVQGRNKNRKRISGHVILCHSMYQLCRFKHNNSGWDEPFLNSKMSNKTWYVDCCVASSVSFFTFAPTFEGNSDTVHRKEPSLPTPFSIVV